MDEIIDASAMATRQASNIPEYGVSELSTAIKRILEGAFGRIRVRGEITELKLYSSGHAYFSLKDEGGKIRAVIWKSAAARVGLKPENGVEVIATGKISAYGDRSEYQLIVERLEYAGIGALLARIEVLKLRLAREGLFDADRKQPLPRLPELIGLITSASGAVLHDIQTTVARRFPRAILLWPVPVQGDGAAERIAEAIEGMDRLPAHGIRRPDVLIVARGGGSLEDLMAFNDEAVVRAAAACRIPLISAVGHETDTTLIDFASDRRAPTPTAAAELAVPARAELAADLAQTAARLVGAVVRTTTAGWSRIETLATRLPDLPALLGHARMRADDRGHRLLLALPNMLAARHAALQRLDRRIPEPNALIATRRHTLELTGLRLLTDLRQAVHSAHTRADRLMPRLSLAPIEANIQAKRAIIAVVGARLEGASYARVLARGFALVRHRRGEPATSAGAVKPGAKLTISFADGDVNVSADRATAAESMVFFEKKNQKTFDY